MPLTDLESQLLAVLRQIEWSGGAGYGDCCPLCNETKPHHLRDCRLADCLMAAAAKQATSTVREARTDATTDVSDLQPAPFPSTPTCPQCLSKAIYQSAESWTDRTRVCSCENGHTWALNAQGVEI